MLPTILLVEDDPTLRLHAISIFEDAGFLIEAVESADEAVSFVYERADCTAFVFTDVQMPGSMDGLDLARLVRTHWPSVGVMVTSGSPVPEASLPEGVRFEAKPWASDTVLAAARAAIAQFR